MIYTTLNKIREHGPCSDGWAKLLRHLGKKQADDESLALGTILESNGLDDALWCLRSVDGHQREMRLYAVWCARQVQHLMTDPRSLAALDVAERHANGQATDEELAAAWDAASAASWAAAWAAQTAASRAASRAASSAASRAASSAASRAAARAAQTAAARAAQTAASRAASSAASRAAAWAAQTAAARAAQTAAARAAQTAEFRRVFCGDGAA